MKLLLDLPQENTMTDYGALIWYRVGAVVILDVVKREANLSRANLRGANLRGANLSRADLSRADLSGADLWGANLSRANLRGANLRGANLGGADLWGADLSRADLSGSVGLLSAPQWVRENFEYDVSLKGFVVYKVKKALFANTWVWEKGSELVEVCNPLPTVGCGCGVNFATLQWIHKNHPESPVWKCLLDIDGMMSLVVPYNTDGKARTGKLILLERV